MVPSLEDLGLIIDFHSKFSKCPMLKRESIDGVLSKRESLTGKQRFLFIIWFQKVWGFRIEDSKIIDSSICTDIRGELELKLILLLSLSCFYDMNFKQLHRLQLNLVASYKNKI
jgi:hypothetical protein